MQFNTPNSHCCAVHAAALEHWHAWRPRETPTVIRHIYSQHQHVINILLSVSEIGESTRPLFISSAFLMTAYSNKISTRYRAACSYKWLHLLLFYAFLKVDHKTKKLHLDFHSLLGWVDNNWIFIFGWTVPLNSVWTIWLLTIDSGLFDSGRTQVELITLLFNVIVYCEKCLSATCWWACMHNRTQPFMINTLPAMTSHNVMKKEIEWSLLTCVTVNVIVLHC